MPGVLKLLGSKLELVKAVQGWPIGAPDDQGSLLYLEEFPEEYRYRVARTSDDRTGALAPPEGYWHPKATVGDPRSKCAVVAMWSPVPGNDWSSARDRRERLWLASINRETLTVQAERLLEVTTPMRNGYLRYDHGVAGGGSLVALVEVPDPSDDNPRWHVTALDCATLKTQWRTPLPPIDPPKQGAAPAAPPDKNRKKIAPPSSSPLPRPSARQDRADSSAEIQFSGDGRLLCVAVGRDDVYGIKSREIHVLAAASGKIKMSLHPNALPDLNVSQMTPVPGQPAVAIHHLVMLRDGPERGRTFLSVSRVDLITGRAATVLSRGELGKRWKNGDSMTPQSSLLVAADQLWLAPVSFEWVAHSGIPGKWPMSDEVDARSPEVAPWISMPREWHRSNRPAVAAHDKWMSTSQ